MNPAMLTLLDGLVIITVLCAIYYLRIVAKSVSIIRQGKNELQQVLKEMTQAILKAEDTIQGMKRLADDKVQNLQKQMDAAQTLTDELNYINQAADTVARRLEKGTTGHVAPAAAKPVAKSAAPAQTVSKAEKELAAAMAKRKQEAGR